MSKNLPEEFQCLVLFAALSGREFTKSDPLLGIKMTNAQIDGYVKDTSLLSVRRKGRALNLSANAEALRWTGENLNLKLEGKNKAVLAVLHLLRRKTAAYLNKHQISFSDFLGTPGSNQETPTRPVAHQVKTEPSPNPAEAVRRAYLELSGGSYDARILLRNLRKRLAIDREAQDIAFRELIQSGEAIFYPEDDPMSRTKEDDEAALILGDRRRHLLYLHKGPRT